MVVLRGQAGALHCAVRQTGLSDTASPHFVVAPGSLLLSEVQAAEFLKYLGTYLCIMYYYLLVAEVKA